ncbi:histidine kinase [Tenacibaculum sp. 190524A05c]|uniref:sensor histidine kinase n=1 Tax=Tenacibaculum platacis TaxID=3137852 RepID=UPI0032B1B23F
MKILKKNDIGKYFQRALLFLIYIYSVISVSAQHPVYYELTEKDGLPDIEFYDVVEDNNGFIWLAANKGLFRYDGKTFKNYTHPQKKGLSVFNLQFDKQGRLWCNNISGQYFFIENDILHYFTDVNVKKKGQLSEFFIHNNKLFVSGAGICVTIDIQTKQKKRIRGGTSDSAFFKHNDSVFYVLKTSVYTEFDQFKKPVDYIDTKGSIGNGLPYVKIRNLGEKNAILLQVYDPHKRGVKLFLREKGKITSLPKQLFKSRITIIDALVEDDFIWIATPNGLHTYTYNNSTFENQNIFFKDYYITKILKDQRNNYWVTTLKNGIFIIPNKNLKYFKDFKHHHITALEKLDNQRLIFGTNKGLLVQKNIITGKVNKLKSYSREGINIIASNGNGKLFISHNNKGYIKTQNKSLFVNNRASKFPAPKGVSFINQNKFVIGQFDRSRIFDLNSNEFTKIEQKRSYSTHYNKQTEKIYIGYVDGLEYYNNNGLEGRKIMFDDKPIFALDITNTSDNVIWVATFSDGIIGVKNGEVIKNYNTNNGLLSNNTSIVKANGTDLWIATDKGIQRLDTKSENFYNITTKDGLTTFNVADIIVYENQVIFGTNNGLFQLDISKGFKPQKLPSFYITKVLVKDEEVEIKDAYKLNPEENKLQFFFHANGFMAEEDCYYQYRLLGASNDWNYVSKNNNQITFNSLSPGKYTFQIKKVLQSNNLESSIKSVEITIQKPYYLQLWFIVLSLTILAVLVILLVKYRIHKLKKQQQVFLEKERLQNQMVASKLKSLQSQLNPHFIFNAMNAIQGLIIKDNKKSAYTYLSKFASLMRDNLEMSERSFVHFNDEIAHLKKYLDLEKLRFEDAFNYKIVNAEDIDNIKIPSTIIQPFIENAIKHGLLHKRTGDKIVIISFEQKSNTLICTIKDNGVGVEKSKLINKSNNSNSFSTKAIEEKLLLLKKYYQTDIGFDYEKVNSGTKVILRIPFTYND